MVNKRPWFGMLVMVLVFGMTAFGCDTGANSDDGTKNFLPDVLKITDWKAGDYYVQFSETTFVETRYYYSGGLSQLFKYEYAVNSVEGNTRNFF